MKIAHVIHGFPPHSNAGAEIYTYKLALAQARTEQVSVFHRVGYPNIDEYSLWREERDGLDIWPVNNNLSSCDSFEDTYTNPPVAQAFCGFLDAVRPDVVHIGHLTLLSTLIVEELARRGIPTLMTLHDYWLICPRGQLLDKNLKTCRNPSTGPCDECQELQLAITETSRKAFNIHRKVTTALHLGDDFMRVPLRWLYLWITRRRGQKEGTDLTHQVERRREHMKAICDRVGLLIAPSNFLREQYIRFGVSPERIVYSDYGFDIAPFRNFRRKPSEKIRFGFVGSIIPSKGLHVLLDAFRGIDADRAELNVFGDFSQYYEFDDYTSRIKSLAAIPGVTMHGGYETDRVADVFSEIDVLVVPSIWYENSPLVIHEARMAGAPVVASNAGGMAELVKHEKSGLLFTLGDAASLREALKRIVEDGRLIEDLRRGIPEVKTIEQDAADMLERYKTCI